MKHTLTLENSQLATAAGMATVTESRYVRDLVLAYDMLERRCDALIERQEAISRAMFRGTDRPSAEPAANAFPDYLGDAAGGSVLTASGQIKPRAQIKFSDITPEDFRKLAEAARKNIHRGSPMGKKRYILNACSLELSEIDEIEIEIMVFQMNMKEIEGLEMDHVPTSVNEVIAKMRFIVGLMLDGMEFDGDYFAYHIEECADVLSELKAGSLP